MNKNEIGTIKTKLTCSVFLDDLKAVCTNADVSMKFISWLRSFSLSDAKTKGLYEKQNDVSFGKTKKINTLKEVYNATHGKTGVKTTYFSCILIPGESLKNASYTDYSDMKRREKSPLGSKKADDGVATNELEYRATSGDCKFIRKIEPKTACYRTWNQKMKILIDFSGGNF